MHVTQEEWRPREARAQCAPAQVMTAVTAWWPPVRHWWDPNTGCTPILKNASQDWGNEGIPSGIRCLPSLWPLSKHLVNVHNQQQQTNCQQTRLLWIQWVWLQRVRLGMFWSSQSWTCWDRGCAGRKAPLQKPPVCCVGAGPGEGANLCFWISKEQRGSTRAGCGLCDIKEVGGGEPPTQARRPRERMEARIYWLLTVWRALINTHFLLTPGLPSTRYPILQRNWNSLRLLLSSPRTQS